jgi:hypothetical protein
MARPLIWLTVIAVLACAASIASMAEWLDQSPPTQTVPPLALSSPTGDDPSIVSPTARTAEDPVELSFALSEHYFIRSALALCANAPKPENQGAQATSDSTPPAPAQVSDGITRGAEGSSLEKQDVEIQDPYSSAVLYLSREIVAKRAELASEARTAYRQVARFEWVIVVIGAITTILISLKSVIDNPFKRWNTWIGVFAIVFSAAGTAASGLNAFYGGREAHARDERLLSYLRRMHNDMAVTVAIRKRDVRGHCMSLADGSENDIQLLRTQLTNWATGLQTILDVPSTTQQDANSKHSATAGQASPP